MTDDPADQPPQSVYRVPTTRLHCCYLDEQAQEELRSWIPLPEDDSPRDSAERNRRREWTSATRCKNPGPIYQITDGLGPDDYTHTCLDHAGPMVKISLDCGSTEISIDLVQDEDGRRVR